MTLHERAIACTKWCCKAVILLTIIGFFIVVCRPTADLIDAIIYMGFCTIIYFPILIIYIAIKTPQHVENFRQEQEHTQREYTTNETTAASI